MKKTFLLAAAAMMIAANVGAQTGYDDTKHEVSIRYGLLPTSEIFHKNSEYENETYLGSFSAEYFYHAKEWLSIGCVFAYGKWKADYIKYDYITGEDKKETYYYTFMPAVKFDYIRKKNFGMYSKAALGVSKSSTTDTYTDGSTHKFSAEYDLNFQATFLGIEAGSPYLRGFAELGIGEQGIASIGVRYKF